MEAILLPTDFSPTAKNAAMYAIELAKQIGVKNIVLYHSYEIPVTVDPLTPGIQMLDLDSLKTSAAEGLDRFELSIKAFAGDIKITSINEFGSLSDGLDEVCEEVNAGLIVMGTTGGGAIEEKLIGSNAVSIAKHSKTPAIIVPKDAGFKTIRTIMLTSDFDRADETIPVNLLSKILDETKARLLVFHMEEKSEAHGVTHSSSVTGETYAINSLLRSFNPEYHFAENKDFVEAVNEFAVAHNVDIIINIPKEHGFFERLFTTSHTKRLAFHSHLPVMVLTAD